MARLRFWWKTGDTVTYEATDATGAIVRTAAGTSLPEAGSTGYYTVEDANVVTGDVAIVSDSSGIVGGGEENPPVILSSDGLDSISITEPSSVAGNFREMMVQVWRRLFGKSTLSPTQLLCYKADGATVATTQTVSETTTLQTQGEAS